MLGNIVVVKVIKSKNNNKWSILQKHLAYESSTLLSTKVVTIDEENNIIDAAKLMTKSGVRRLPVIKDDKLIGI